MVVVVNHCPPVDPVHCYGFGLAGFTLFSHPVVPFHPQSVVSVHGELVVQSVQLYGVVVHIIVLTTVVVVVVVVGSTEYGAGAVQAAVVVHAVVVAHGSDPQSDRKRT